MSVAALPLHFNRVHSSYTGYGSLSKMTFGIEPETPRKTQCTILYNLYFLNLYEDVCSELLTVFGNLDLHFLFFPFFQWEKLLRQEFPLLSEEL